MKGRFNIKRMIIGTLWTIVGTAGIGLGSACFRTASMGLDALGSLVTGTSQLTGFSYGNCQLGINLVILVIMLFAHREAIGIGTLVSMSGVGYVSDFGVWLIRDVFGLTDPGMIVRIIFLIPGLFFLGFGIALYMSPRLGTCPYDDIPVMLEMATKRKLPFVYGRILTDILAMILGVSFCLLADQSVLLVLGVGTVFNAVLTGPIIKFCRDHFTEKLVKRSMGVTTEGET